MAILKKLVYQFVAGRDCWNWVVLMKEVEVSRLTAQPVALVTRAPSSVQAVGWMTTRAWQARGGGQDTNCNVM
jgi:hypothetical protein